jgi:hypothetical protein
MPLLPPGPGEDQILGAGTVGEPAGDGLADLVAHGHNPDAGQALGFGLEAAAEPAGVNVTGSLARLHRIFAVLDLTPEVSDQPGARPLVRARGAVAFDKVSFAYAPACGRRCRTCRSG